MTLKEVLQIVFEAGYKTGINRQSLMRYSMMPEETSLEQMFELVWNKYKDQLPPIEVECECEKNTGGTVKKVLKCGKCGKDVKGIKFET